MNEIQRTYWDAFNQLGNEKLHQYGFTFELLPAYQGLSELFRIRLTRHNREYLLSFSTHHLDFQDGVKVVEEGNLVLPPPELYSIGEGLYGYTDQSIKDLLNDLCFLK
jgi:hypothetical protein